MKRLFPILLITLLSFTGIAQEQQYKQFAVKSGYIEYELTGNTTGTKKFWWTDYGNKSRTEIKATSVVKMLGMTSKEEVHSVNITNGTTNYTQDLVKGTAYKTSNEEYIELGEELTKDMTEAELQQMADEILESLGGERLGTEKVLGKECEVIKVMMAKVWIYKGLPLKSEAKVMRMVANETATKFDENIQISSSKFEPEKGVEYIEIEEMYEY